MPKTKTKKRKPKAALPAANGNGAVQVYQQRPPLGVVSSTGSYFGSFVLGNGKFIPTPYNPDDLARRKGIKIYREMMRDEQVKAALSAKKFAVLSTGWEIHLPETDEEPDDTLTEYKEFVEFNFNEMQGNFDSKLLDIMSALAYGFSCTEKEYWAIDYGPFKGKWGIKNLRTRPPDDIQFEVDSAGDLTANGVLQNNVKMPADKFVIYSHSGSFGNYYGESDIKAAYNAWWVKTNLFRILPISMERFAEPIAVASFEGTELQQEQRDDLMGFLKNLQSRSGIVLPKTIELKLMEPTKDVGAQYKLVLDYCDQLIRMAILMPSLMGMSGEQQVGSLARSQTEFDVFVWILNHLRRELETCINELIVKPILDFNYEIEHGEYPCFKFKEITEEMKQNQYQLFLMGLTAGALTKGPEDENNLRDLINIQPLPQEWVDQQEEIEQAKMDNELEMAKMGPIMPGAPGMNGNGNGGPPAASTNGNGNQPPGKAPVPKPGQNYATFSEEQEAALIEYVEGLQNVAYSFPDHKGRPGEVGGSMPRGESVSPTDEAALKAKIGIGDRSKLPSDVPELRAEGTLFGYKGDSEAFDEWLGKGTQWFSPSVSAAAKAGKPFSIYRAVPNDVSEIHPGAYVTQSEAYARFHIRSNLGGKGHILKLTVTADDLVPVNPNEFYYAPGQRHR